MTTAQSRLTTDALAPVREALLRHAREDADRLLAAADEAAEATLAAARREAATIRDEARAQGHADAVAVLTGERARTRRRARAIMLAAQGAAYEELRRAASDAVTALREDPAYPTLLAHLSERARQDLGPTAVVTEHPRGGVVAEAPGRRATYLLTDLADRAVAAMGPDLEGLWAQ